MDQLQIFASEVSRVAREVGTEGILGGQAQISGVDGTWKELTDNGVHSSISWRRLSPLVDFEIFLQHPLIKDSERNGAKSYGSSTRNRLGYNSCGPRRFDSED